MPSGSKGFRCRQHFLKHRPERTGLIFPDISNYLSTEIHATSACAFFPPLARVLVVFQCSLDFVLQRLIYFSPFLKVLFADAVTSVSIRAMKFTFLWNPNLLNKTPKQTFPETVSQATQLHKKGCKYVRSLHKICFQCSKLRAAESYYQLLWQWGTTLPPTLQAYITK